MYGWRMTGMNQSALEGFVKIVELNSYSAAAEALYLSQSALSQQIRTLEGQLGVELFQHVPRRVLLTPAGQDFYPKAKQRWPCTTMPCAMRGPYSTGPTLRPGIWRSPTTTTPCGCSVTICLH